MKQLKTGDPCPCCGRPIKSRDPDVLRLLGWVAENGRLPTVAEIEKILGTEGQDGATDI